MSEWGSEAITLQGLSVCASQIWGGVRLVPLVRDQPIEDLRLARECWGEVTSVRLADKTSYTAFVPHAFIASWGEAALGTQVVRGKGEARQRGVQRMAKRRREKQGRGRPRKAEKKLRFLPLHLAMEAYLALHFAGPDVLRPEYSEEVLKYGLSPRSESTIPGEWIPGLEEALRVFEIREGQVGVLIFVADHLAAAFVVPHPSDYRQLHRSLLRDFYGELIYRQGCLHQESAQLLRPMREQQVDSIEDLGVELARMRADWSQFLHGMASGLFEQPAHLQHVYRLGSDYRLYRFLPEFRFREENHIGELIRGREGETAYLKTFRLSAAQVRRGYLLSSLARHDWDLDACALTMQIDRKELIRRIVWAGLGYMVRPHLRQRGKYIVI